MIPIGLFSLEQVLFVAFLLLTTLVWLCWSAYLPFAPAPHRLAGLTSKIVYGVVSCIALFTLYKIVDLRLHLSAYRAEMESQYMPVLEAPARWGHIDMPAQTQLHLAVAHEMDSFSQAVFPEPVDIAGIAAREVTRYVAIHTDANYQTSGYTPQNLRVMGEGVSAQEGWLCDNQASPVEFDLRADGAIASFYRCVLAEGNVVDGMALPAGSVLRSSSGNAYPDGFVDQDRWVIDVPQGQEVLVHGLPLLAPVIALSQARTLYEINRATLARAAEHANTHYAAGASVRFNPRSSRGLAAAEWVIEPVAEPSSIAPSQ